MLVFCLSLDFFDRRLAAIVLFDAGDLAEPRLAPQLQSLGRGVNHEEDIDADQCEQINYVDNANVVNRVLLEHVNSVQHCNAIKLQ